MMRRVLLCFVALAVTSLSLRAQVNLDEEFFSLPDPLTDEYLDSLTLQVAKPNDYWMIGVYGGISLQYGYFNPTRLTKFQMQYPVYGFSVVRHYTMFGIFPNMGMEFGFQQNYEGYEFKVNKETGYRSVESGAYKVMMPVPEVFYLSHFHLDAGEHFKVMAKVGIYGGYRRSISRVLDENYVGYNDFDDYVEKFRDYDRRWTYGVQGGIGAAVMFSPFEFHLNAQIKWGWNSFWNPDYYSQYYYRFGYPLDGAVTFGIYYQLTPRYGHTRAQLKRLARKMVEESQSQNNPQ